MTDQEAWAIVLKNQGLAYTLAKKLSGAHIRKSLDLVKKRGLPGKQKSHINTYEVEPFQSISDALQEALLELFRCVRTFDPSKGTLATFFYSHQKKLWSTLAMAWPMVKPSRDRQAKHLLNGTRAKSLRAWESSHWIPLVRRTTTTSGFGDNTSEEYLPSDDPSPADDFPEENLDDALVLLKRACAGLHEPERAAWIFECYYGYKQTLGEIGSQCALTRERVRQILEKIQSNLEKLREKEAA